MNRPTQKTRFGTLFNGPLRIVTNNLTLPAERIAAFYE